MPKELFESSLKTNGSERVYIGIVEVVKDRTTSLYEFSVYDVIYSNAFFSIARIDDNTVEI